MIDLKPACRVMADLLNGIFDDRLRSPTPCAEYTVADLIDHVEVTARGSLGVARKNLGGWDGAGLIAGHGADRRRDVADWVGSLGDAWEDPAAWAGVTAVSADLELSNEVWGRIALTEMVVHGWDLAAATDQPFELPEQTLRACLDHVVQFVPNAPVPALWGPEIPTTDGDLIARIVAVTGRDPHWREGRKASA